MLKAVIFDMDGVIVNSEPYHKEVEKEIFDTLKISPSIEDSHFFIGISAEKMCKFLIDKFKLDITVEKLIELDNKIRVDYMSKQDIQPMPGVISLIKEIKQNNIQLALASSSSHDLINVFTEKLNIKNYFDVIVSGYDVKHGKPDPDIFILTAEKLKINRDECIVIEDSANGVKAAKNAKMICLGYKNKDAFSQNLSIADYIIEDFNNINFEMINNFYQFSQTNKN